MTLDEVTSPEGEDGEDLQASRLGRGPSEDVVYHDSRGEEVEMMMAE